jgi:hypothetical protein
VREEGREGERENEGRKRLVRMSFLLHSKATIREGECFFPDIVSVVSI